MFDTTLTRNKHSHDSHTKKKRNEMTQRIVGAARRTRRTQTHATDFRVSSLFPLCMKRYSFLHFKFIFELQCFKSLTQIGVMFGQNSN